MPTHFGRSKEQDFQFIMDRIWNKLKGWKEKSLSSEGRGILIRAVAHAIPTYIMSCFLLPKDLYDKIEKTVCAFWWGSMISVKKELNRLYILGTLITWFASYPAKSSQILKNHSIMLFTSNANFL